MTTTLAPEWKDRLGLTHRRSPELYESAEAVSDVPHAPANHAQKTVQARDAFFRKSQVRRVINFADLRFQLFEKAHRPTALIIYGNANVGNFPYRFDYWAPKADLNLRIKRVITLSSADKASLGVGAVLDNPLIFKQRLWMREPDAKLFGYLARLPKLEDFVNDFGGLSRRREEPGDRWVIGQGYPRLKFECR